MFQALSYFDRRVTRGWFRNQAGVKLIVVMGFLLTIILVMVGIYGISSYFLKYLSTYSIFGELIAVYILQAAMLVTAVMAVFSYTVSLYGTLVASPQSGYWLTLPIRRDLITRVLALRVLVFGSWPFVVILLPTLLAWVGAENKAWRLPGTYLSLPILVMMAFSVGIWVLTLSQKLLLSWGRKGFFLLLLIGLIILAGLIRLLFPPSFFKLAESATESQFRQEFEALPLMSPILPTWWLTQTLFSNQIGSLVGLGLLVIGFFYLSEQGLESRHLPWWYEQRQRPTLEGKAGPKAIKRFYWPKTDNQSLNIAWVNFLRWQRNRSDLIYFGFVLVLSGLFAGIMAIFPRKMPIEPQWLAFLFGAVMAGFGFLTTVMAIRFIYPLMAIEGRSIWQIFTAPLPRWRIFDAKLLISLLILIPWILIAMTVSYLLPLPGVNQTWLMLTLTAMALGIMLINLTLGVIAPNFSEPDNPSVASTSTSGLAALILSIGWVTLMVKFYLNSRLMTLGVFGGEIMLVGVASASLILTAIYRLNRYEKII